MPFAIPTLDDLVQRTWRAFRANLKGSDAKLWPNNVAVSAKVMAGAVWSPFSFLEYISRQILVHTADGQWLDRHAYDWGLARLAPTYAEGKVTISGTEGVAVPAGAVVQRADGVLYDITLGGVVGAGGTVDVSVKAQVSGRAANAVAGVAMILTSPIAGVDSDAEVADDGIGLGADLESDDSLRARILFRKRMPPHGGAAHDYVAWMREINGVTRVFVDPRTTGNSRTTIGIWFLMDELYTDGIPQSADVARAEALIDGYRPAGAIVEIAAPTAVPQNITIALSPDNTAVRDAVRLELAEMFRREARVSTLTSPFTLYRSLISEAVSIATGEHHHTLVSPSTDQGFTAGQIPTLGTITFA